MSGDAGLDNGQGNVVGDELLEVGNAAAAPEMDGLGVNDGEPQGFLEIVYGVLFDPVKTMKRAAANPPLVTALVIVTILSILGTLMGLLTFSRVLSQSLDTSAVLPGALLPVGAFIGLVFSYVKWFGYSAVLHLAADLLGGRGVVRGVFAAVGLAGLPNTLLAPFQFLGYWYGLGNLAVTVLLLLAGLAAGIWSSVVLVIGIREVYRLPTGRSVLVFFIPYLALFLLLILSVIAVVLIFSAFPINTNIPGYF
ncbi:YIP1 family protein [Pelotomaculum propionicicum]|uniref:YIP1 family protein n=1 Tax=Pelotomaculum propionicicum TaxID=258475 RepID=UPI003B7600D2